jgi:hypothetical protein
VKIELIELSVMMGVLVSVPSFHHCNNLSSSKGGKIYLGSQFQRLQVMVTWLHCFWLCDETEPHRKAKLLTSWRPESKDRQEEPRGNIYPSKPYPQYLLPATRLYLLSATSH